MTLPGDGQFQGSQIIVSIPASALEHYLTVGGDQEVIGSIFGDIAKGIGKVLQSDYVQGAASAALSAYGVPPQITRGALEMGGRLVEKAAKGHPKARAKVAEVRRRAAAGEPRAKRAAAVIDSHVRSQKQARAAMTLLHRAQTGDQRAATRVQQIEAAAERGDRRATHATRAMRAVLDASRQATGQPPPPVARRRPAPPAVSPQSRVINVQQTPDGKRLVTIEVGGAGWEWMKRNFGLHRGVRPESEVFGLRDAYLLGLSG